MNTVPRLSDSAGARIRLGRMIGRGGEGAVYILDSKPGLAAKIYHEVIPSPKVVKLKHLCRMAQDKRLNSFAALPVDLIFDGSGLPVGIQLPLLVGHQDIHHLYSPKSRRKVFPQADMRFLVRASQNLAKAFGAIHASQMVIGDVNHGSVLVADDSRVRLIDADSFQLRVDGTVHRSLVGVPMFTPPELQGIAFADVDRTSNHDAFGLAVLLFQLLMHGRHPYVGRYRDDRYVPVERAIQQHHFAFSASASRVGLERPPMALPLSHLTPPVQSLFERAFSSGSTRPDAREWISALKGLEASLRACAHSGSHQYPSHLGVCPWCSFESQGLVLFVSSRTLPRGAAVDDLADVWRLLEKSPAPPSIPSNLLHQAGPAALPTGLLTLLGWLSGVVMLIALGVFAESAALGTAMLTIGIGFGFYAVKRCIGISKLNADYAAAQRAYQQAVTNLQEHPRGCAYAMSRRRLGEIRRTIDELPALRTRQLQELERRQQELQLQDFLEATLLIDASVRGIGPGRVATLASYGIESAWDIDARNVQGVPGFGPALAQRLLAWRQHSQRQFRYNPNKPLDPVRVRAIDDEMHHRAKSLKSEARNLARRLPAEHKSAANQQASLERHAADALRKLAAAKTSLSTG